MARPPPAHAAATHQDLAAMPGQPERKHASHLDDDLTAQRKAGRRIALLVAAALVAALLGPFLAWQLSV